MRKISRFFKSIPLLIFIAICYPFHAIRKKLQWRQVVAIIICAAILIVMVLACLQLFVNPQKFNHKIVKEFYEKTDEITDSTKQNDWQKIVDNKDQAEKYGGNLITTILISLCTLVVSIIVGVIAFGNGTLEKIKSMRCYSKFLGFLLVIIFLIPLGCLTMHIYYFNEINANYLPKIQSAAIIPERNLEEYKENIKNNTDSSAPEDQQKAKASRTFTQISNLDDPLKVDSYLREAHENIDELTNDIVKTVKLYDGVSPRCIDEVYYDDILSLRLTVAPFVK